MAGISIVIPTYNRGDFINEAINSVLSQDYEGFLEIIISDDGSTDKTIEIAKTFGEKVNIILKDKDCVSQGAAAARNRGIEASTQDYICFLDSDDYFLPGHLKKMVFVLESESNLNYVFCRVLEMKEENDSRLYKKWTKINIEKRDIKNLVVSKHNVVCTIVFIFKKEVFQKVGVFNENYKNAEDIDMWMRISEQFDGAFSDHFGAVFRKHGINHLTDNPKLAIVQCQYRIFKNALIRYFKLELTDSYRLKRLVFFIVKYKVGSVRIFHLLYKIMSYSKNRKASKGKNWFPLSHFSSINTFNK